MGGSDPIHRFGVRTEGGVHTAGDWGTAKWTHDPLAGRSVYLLLGSVIIPMTEGTLGTRAGVGSHYEVRSLLDIYPPRILTLLVPGPLGS